MYGMCVIKCIPLLDTFLILNIDPHNKSISFVNLLYFSVCYGIFGLNLLITNRVKLLHFSFYPFAKTLRHFLEDTQNSNICQIFYILQI